MSFAPQTPWCVRKPAPAHKPHPHLATLACARGIASREFILSGSPSSYPVGRRISSGLIGGLEDPTCDRLLLGAPAVLLGAGVGDALARARDPPLLRELGAEAVGGDCRQVAMR